MTEQLLDIIVHYWGITTFLLYIITTRACTFTVCAVKVMYKLTVIYCKFIMYTVEVMLKLASNLL